MDFEAGEILLIDKELGWTSFDAVNRVRNIIQKKINKKIKVGHAGTLDPLATGLLIICTGKYTRKITDFQELDKKYTGSMVIGASTPSFDLETRVEKSNPPLQELPDIQVLNELTKSFIGEVSQIPPVFSAMKVKGERSYNLAREGREVELSPRIIKINSFKIPASRSIEEGIFELDFEIHCGKGTYIRSMAKDFGQVLGTGAYLSALRRTGIGEFNVKESQKIEEFSNKIIGLI